MISIIIPCFNEEKRIRSEKIIEFLKEEPSFHFTFVNDGSTDQTGTILNELKAASNTQITIITLDKNQGKAVAVRQGVVSSLQKKAYSRIGYFDVDLSTSLDELVRINDIMVRGNYDYVFGSRMKKLNATITRSNFRHITGRVITTIIDSRFHLGIYDTQCGAKLFSAEMVAAVCREPFVSKWLFDVEIFLRIRKECPKASGEEIPLLKWTSQKGSKINIMKGPALMIELIRLFKNYPAKN